MKKLSLLFAALLTATVMNLHAVDITSWTIAGPVSLMGSQWDYSDTKNDMKLVKGSYELKKFVYLAESSYEYVAVANHTSGVKDIPEYGTQVLNISADGDYIVTFTLDAAGTTLTADAELYTSEDALVDTYVNDESMGSVTGAGEYALYGQVTLTATPNDGYKFVNWSGDQTGTDNPLSFTVSTLYTAVQANFEVDEPAVETYGRKVTNGNYGTICLAKQFTSMEGVEGLYVPSYMTPDTTTLYCVEMPLDSVKAGYSYIFKSNADSVTFFMEGEASGIHTHNYMKGNLEGDTELIPELMDYMEGIYILANNELVKPAVGSTIKNNTAMIILIDVPTTKPASVAGRKMVAIGRNTPTGLMQNAQCTMQNGKMMINGQLIIIRDSVKFNAMGVKL